MRSFAIHAACCLVCLAVPSALAEEIVVEKRPHTAEWKLDATIAPPATAKRITAPDASPSQPWRVVAALAHGSQTETETPLLRLAGQTTPVIVSSPGRGKFYHGFLSGARWEATTKPVILEPGLTVSPGQPLATWIPADARLELVAALQAQSLAGLEVGTSGAALVLANPLQALPVAVTSIATTPLPDGATEVKLHFSSPPPATLHPGQILPVRLVANRPPAIMLPVRALRWNAGTWLVSIRLADGKTAPRAVRLGTMLSDQVEVTSGLEIGQVVVVHP